MSICKREGSKQPNEMDFTHCRGVASGPCGRHSNGVYIRVVPKRHRTTIFLAVTSKTIIVVALMGLLVLPAAYSKTLIVKPDGSEDYQSIQAAIDAATTGDTVYVKPGTYEEHIDFKSGITLEGAGRDVTIIYYSGDNSVLTAESVTSGTIDGFSFEHRGHHRQCAVRLITSSLTLSNNIIASAPADGIVLSGEGNIIIENNILHGNGNSGIWAYGQARGIIRHNEISGSKKYEGIAVYDRCSLYVLSNTVWGNARDGIRISDSSGVIWGNEIYDNGDEGVDVRGTATPLVEKNTVRRNAGEGIGLWGQARATIRGNDVYENEDDGIHSAYENKSLVEYNRVYSNNDDGVVVAWPSQPTVGYNDVFKNGDDGISIWGPRLHYDDLLFLDLKSADYHLDVVTSEELNRHFGVLLVKTAEGRLAALYITFSDEAPCTMTIEEGSLYQISGTLSRSLKEISVENHDSYNLEAAGKADLLFLCSSRANSYRIEALNGAAFTLPTEQVNGLGPIPSGFPVVSNNTIVSNPNNGILVGYGAKPLVQYNLLVNNKWDGVDTTISGWTGGTFGPDGEPAISYNNVWGSKQNYEGLAKPLSDICVDPLFVALEGSDFRLTASSPCIGVGPDGTTLGAHPYYNQPPIATFDESSDVNDKQCVTFEAFGSHDPDGFLASYEWDFDQDGTIDAEGITVFHVFPASGSYSIELTVTDNEGAIDSVTHKITVQLDDSL